MTDEQYERKDKFLVEFKALVRKHLRIVPETPGWSTVHPDDAELLGLMQDSTSLYSPYIWSDRED